MSLIAASTAWQEHAACLQIDTSFFFPNSSSTSKLPSASTAWERARAVCDTCPVRGKCLDFAIKWRLNDGMYGGKTPEQRNKIRQDRKKVSW